jgi:hypothetical protein
MIRKKLDSFYADMGRNTFVLENGILMSNTRAHTHTHTHIYIYIYMCVCVCVCACVCIKVMGINVRITEE